MPTHGPGLLPFATIHDFISKINPRRHLEDPMGVSVARDCTPYNPRTVLKGCITSDGGKSNVHPSGKRTFNCRELACLQTFPPTHHFAGGISKVRLQIANAVPPLVAEKLFREITKSIRRSDAEMAAWRPEVVMLD